MTPEELKSARHALGLSAEGFGRWLSEMKRAGLASTDAEAGEIIGKNKNSVVNYKRRGADKTVALACQAALSGLEPYGS